MHQTLRQTLDHLPSLYRRALRPDGRLMVLALQIASLRLFRRHAALIAGRVVIAC